MVYAVLLKIMHTTHVTVTGVYKSVVNEIDHDRARPQFLRYPYSAERATCAPEKCKTGTPKSWFQFICAGVKLFEYYYSRHHSPSFLGHVVVTN